jgi:membrane protease YdiL (CAAX protease family)
VARRGPAALTDAGRTLTDRPRLWPVFLSCLAAFVAIVAFSLVAGAIVRELYPDLSGRAAFEGLPGLLALTIASSAGFILTALIASGGGTATALRLTPGTESGRALLLMTLGTLALGQALDSLVTLVGLAQHGSMVTIRRALAEAVGPDLLLAVLVVGLVAGTAEEAFFRGYMQTRLAQRLPRAAAIAITAFCFGLFHMDWLHGLLALALGLYLGWITELTGSALPAVVCHVINNALFTILTASLGMIEGFRINVALGIGGTLVFAGCVAWLHVSPRVRRTTS